VPSEETGLLFDPHDEEALASRLERLLTDEVLRRRLGERARARAQEAFGMDRALEAITSVYADTGARNVFEAAIRAGVEPVIHCSTVGVHSHIPNPPAAEDEPYQLGDVY
jgi:hypothetical protein